MNYSLEIEGLVKRKQELDAEVGRLRRGIQDYLNGDYDPRIKKMDKCKHGQYGYEACEACIDEHFQKVLNGH